MPVEITITWPRKRAYLSVLLGRWRPDRFDPKKIKFWSPLRRLKIALGD